MRRGQSRDRWSSGGPAEEKARNTAFPNAAMFTQNHNYFPRRCNAELAPPASPGKKCWNVRRSNELGGEFGITPRRLRVSLPAPSPRVADAKIPCLSSAGPPLLQRSARANANSIFSCSSTFTIGTGSAHSFHSLSSLPAGSIGKMQDIRVTALKLADSIGDCDGNPNVGAVEGESYRAGPDHITALRSAVTRTQLSDGGVHIIRHPNIGSIEDQPAGRGNRIGGFDRATAGEQLTHRTCSIVGNPDVRSIERHCTWDRSIAKEIGRAHV